MQNKEQLYNEAQKERQKYVDAILNSNSNKKIVIAGIDFLVFSLAAAELREVGGDEEKMILMENIRTDVSINLKSLLG